MKSKKILLITFMLLFNATLGFGAHIEIGDGTSNTAYNPCYGYRNYSWSQTIYLQSEIDTTLYINAISYNISNTPSNYEMINQKVFMGHTSDNLFTDNTLIDTIGMTKVFDGTVIWDVGGWFRINLTTPFSYNNVDNLLIVWVNYDGTYFSGYPRFYYTNQTDRMVYCYSDNTIPIPGGTGTLNYYVSNIRLHYLPSPTDLEAEGEHLCIELTWNAPIGVPTPVEYVLDDSSYESGWTSNPGYEIWLGNLFPVFDTGELISFDLYTEFNANAGSDLLEIDIFDAAHNLVGSSESFVPVPNTWTTISCPNVPFNGEFYAMVHYNYESAQSHWLGFDQNGPNANSGLDWYTDGSIWELLHVIAGGTPGVFMLRAFAMIQGELREITVGKVDYTQTVLSNKDEIAYIGKTISGDNPIYNPNPSLNYGELDSYKITIIRDDHVCDGYNIYRVDEGLIGYIPIEEPRFYRDIFVAVGVEYTYWVTAVYTDGESGPSNYASAVPAILGNWEETFDVDWHLTGWTEDPPSPNNWSWSHGYSVLNWSPSTPNYDMSLISPPIILPDDPADIFDIIVNMYIYDYTTDNGEIMEILIIHDGVETMIFEWDLDVNDNWGSLGGTDFVYSDTGQFAGETVQFKFRSHGGDTSNFNYWYVYNVFFGFIGVPPEYGALQGTVTDGYMNPIEGAEITVIGDLYPLGRYVVTTDELGYYEIDPIIAQFYNLTSVCYPYVTVEDTFTVFPDSTLVYDFIMGMPTIEVTPDSVTMNLDPNTQGTEFLTVSNDGNASLGWYANIEFPEGDNDYKNIPSDLELISLIRREPNKNTSAEYSPEYRTISGINTKEIWDLQFVYPVGGELGEAGVECDGNYIYTTNWGYSGNAFYRYGLDGTYIEQFTVTGCPGSIRDLAYDGQYFYGGAITSTVYEMDFDNQNVVSTINAPVVVRAIAYDCDNDGFWANNWSTPITLFDRAGNFIRSFPCQTFGDFYGFAYDNFSYGGPYLWGFCQEGISGKVIVQFDVTTGLETGVTFDLTDDLGVPGIAGGLFISEDVFVPGTVTIGGMSQNNVIFGYELCPYVNWINIDPTSGIVAPGNNSLVTLYFDSVYLPDVAIVTADIHFFSIPDVGDPLIPITLIVGTPEYGNLDGTVTDAGTGAPIEGVLVTSLNTKYSTMTNNSGYYLIEDMFTGIYNITFEKEGYNIGLEDSVEIIVDQTTTLNYAMTAPELTFDPISFVFDLEPGSVYTDTLAIENIGMGSVDFFIDIDYVTDNRQITILCVDRDGSSDANYTDDWPYFQAALDAGGYSYTYYEVIDISQDGPDLTTMMDYEVIIWFSGESWGYYGHDCMTYNDEINLAAYLDGGGALFLSAQDYLYASYPTAGSFIAGQFPYDYLGLRSVNQDVWYILGTGTVEGVTGSLAEGYIFNVQDIYTAKDGLYIDWFTDHVGDDLFNITSPSPKGICANQYDAVTFRTVFTTASFAAITDPTIQADLINDIIIYLHQWLTVDPMSGTIDPSTIAELILTVDTDILENGDYYENIVVGTENPDIGQTIIPVHLHVGPAEVEEGSIPVVTKLNYNLPNPFSHSTTISFSLKEKSHVNLSVYNIKGQLVATLVDEMMKPGLDYKTVWDGNSDNKKLCNGIYFYKLETKDKTFIKKMLLIK